MLLTFTDILVVYPASLVLLFLFLLLLLLLFFVCFLPVEGPCQLPRRLVHLSLLLVSQRNSNIPPSLQTVILLPPLSVVRGSAVELVLFRDSLLPRPENGPEPWREKRESCITCRRMLGTSQSYCIRYQGG